MKTVVSIFRNISSFAGIMKFFTTQRQLQWFPFMTVVSVILTTPSDEHINVYIDVIYFYCVIFPKYTESICSFDVLNTMKWSFFKATYAASMGDCKNRWYDKGTQVLIFKNGSVGNHNDVSNKNYPLYIEWPFIFLYTLCIVTVRTLMMDI